MPVEFIAACSFLLNAVLIVFLLLAIRTNFSYQQAIADLESRLSEYTTLMETYYRYIIDIDSRMKQSDLEPMFQYNPSVLELIKFVFGVRLDLEKFFGSVPDNESGLLRDNPPNKPASPPRSV